MKQRRAGVQPRISFNETSETTAHAGDLSLSKTTSRSQRTTSINNAQSQSQSALRNALVRSAVEDMGEFEPVATLSPAKEKVDSEIKAVERELAELRAEMVITALPAVFIINLK